jgi:hypothetical protein
MKLSFLLFASSFLLSSSPAAAAAAFRPTQIPLDSLLDDQAFTQSQDSFWDALSQVGMVSITNIQGFDPKETMKSLHPCISSSSASQTQVLQDGTHRLTFATHTVPGPGGMQDTIIFNDEKDLEQEHEACALFSTKSLAFREQVAVVIQAFSKRLGSLLKREGSKKPLLNTLDGYSFDSLQDVVENGEHLEHFHAYQLPGMQNSHKQEGPTTIDWHTDQGLFIVFTPGLMVSAEEEDSTTSLSGGFVIQHQDGSQTSVEFNDEDELVIMLGDGVNQIINSRTSSSQNAVSKNASPSLLRATPHALSIHATSTGKQVRVWYGRMVLPPSSALHPQHPTKTFGQVRQAIADNRDAEFIHQHAERLSIACSSASKARRLETTVCEQGSIYCWHRCMSVDDASVSNDICASQGLDLVCQNPRGQISSGDEHGDFYPGCLDLNTASNVTEFPTLPEYPRDEESCSDEAFATFYKKGDKSELDNEQDLGDGAIFKWSVKENVGAGSSIVGKLFYNGIFGYIALGIGKEGGEKNGMHGASIIMALPGDDYDAATGLVLGEDKINVQEYVIDPEDSAFRHWQTPVSSVDDNSTTSISRSGNLSSYTVESTDCFTVLSFDTSHIHNVPFNVTGTDNLIWAVNTMDYFVSYHTARGRFSIEWPTGTVVSLNGESIGDNVVEDTSASPATFSFGFSKMSLLAFGALFTSLSWTT